MKGLLDEAGAITGKTHPSRFAGRLLNQTEPEGLNLKGRNCHQSQLYAGEVPEPGQQ